MKMLKKLLIASVIFLVVSVSFILWANHKIETSSKDFVTYDITKLPDEKAGLLLGTSKTVKNGTRNLYFYYRIKATAELYKSGKIKYVIVSGDNSKKDYNETEDMKLDLINLGIPAENIFEDYAGFRTLDSIVRAKEIFGQKSFIIISQEFHNERAVYLAQQNGLTAYGYNATDVNKYYGFKTKLREYLARAKVFIDLACGVEPKFYGEKISIP